MTLPLPRTRDGRIVQLDLKNAPQLGPAFSPSGPPLLSTELKDLTSQSNFDICRQTKNGLGATQKEADSDLPHENYRNEKPLKGTKP